MGNNLKQEALPNEYSSLAREGLSTIAPAEPLKKHPVGIHGAQTG
ncbi:MAG: hypothetical protein ABEI32_00340 [Halothece sp.]